MFKVNNKDTRMTPFEQVNAGLDSTHTETSQLNTTTLTSLQIS